MKYYYLKLKFDKFNFMVQNRPDFCIMYFLCIFFYDHMICLLYDNHRIFMWFFPYKKHINSISNFFIGLVFTFMLYILVYYVLNQIMLIEEIIFFGQANYIF
jgi:hypothetical protein